MGLSGTGSSMWKVLRGRENVGSGTCSQCGAAVREEVAAGSLMVTLFQVLGRKYIRLYSPQESEAVYPHDTHLLHNTSQVEPRVASQLLHPPSPETRHVTSFALSRLMWRILTWRSSPSLLRPRSCPASYPQESFCSSPLNIGITCGPST